MVVVGVTVIVIVVIVVTVVVVVVNVADKVGGGVVEKGRRGDLDGRMSAERRRRRRTETEERISAPAI